MKSTLRISLKSGERIFINGAVLRVDRKVALEFMNDVTFLLENHVLQPEQANTPLRQLYFIAQMMLINPEGKEQSLAMFRKSITMLLACFKDDEVLAELKRDFGTWHVAWGDLNRFQRVSNGDALQMDDSKASIPVPFTSSAWGQLPSYTSRSIQGSKKWYGVNGNSFIAAVEFGPKINAYSLLAGGQNGSLNSPHFFDQGQMYAGGKFKDIYFYKSDVLKHAVASYHP